MAADLLTLPYLQRGVAEVLALSLAAGLLGTWIVLRGLAFFAHAVATATFPGLVLADGLGFAAPLGAAGTAALFSLALTPEFRRRADGDGHDAGTALALAGALAAGTILASDVFHSAARVDTLLFGSLLTIGWGDVALAAGVSGLALAGTLVLGERWLAAGFDPGAARALGLRSAAADLALLALVAAAAVAALAALGALLAGALLVVPAATTRMWTRRLGPWRAASVALAAAEGVAGLWLAERVNAPPGAAVAVLGGAVFAASALARRLGAAEPRRALSAVAVAVAGLGTAAAAAGGSAFGPGLRVVASTTQLGDIARVVGGRDTAVHQLLQPNTDPHEYDPRPRDVRAVAGARIVLESGLGLDRWMDRVLRDAGGHPRVVALAPARIPVLRRGDPHWWHDPRNAAAAALAVGRILGAADPGHRAAYARRARAFAARVRALDHAIAACLDAVPAGRRRLVTDHDAFGYFAARYGIRVVGAVIPSQSSAGQPSARSVAQLARLIRRARVPAVLPEASASPRLARALAAHTGARADLTLYGDTLGPAGSPGATYLGMERANADALARAFGRRGGCR